MENRAASGVLCGDLESVCEAELDRMQLMHIPSLHKFETSFYK